MLVEAEIWTIARTDQGNAVLVRPVGSESAVPIFIGQLEAQSILIGLGNVPMPRPLTHDLFLSLFSMLGAELQRIEITALKEGTFYAQIILSKTNGEELIVDARPSDSIGIAVRAKCPVYIDEAVVDEAGISVSAVTSGSEEGIANPYEQEKRRLEEELNRAVEVENYEEAAKIRDKLRKLADTFSDTNEEGE
ncbi:bifunctional nuclease family protein [Marispirochaeta sp.]|uniref:bifunctional nuclease family protein n=1 Tax=Marispirochaeta sp. TaxID=2038653 RepID=UPI0029C8CF49|nr:bifunctional nuclease family protein [Marispirochaeta sp.]